MAATRPEGHASVAMAANAANPAIPRVECFHMARIVTHPSSREVRTAAGLLRALVDKLLNTVALRFASDDVALQVSRDAVKVKELTGFPSRASNVPDLLHGLAVEDGDPLIRPVCDIDEALLRIGREGDAKRRARAARLPPDISLFHESTVDPERLDPVVGAVGKVDQAVVGYGNAVRRVELLRSRPLEEARVGRAIVGLVAIRAPVTLVCPGVSIKDDDAPVPVSVSDEYLVGLRVDDRRRRPAQVVDVVAVD